MLEIVNPAHSDRKSTRLNSSHRCISYAAFSFRKTQRRPRLVVLGVKKALRPRLPQGRAQIFARIERAGTEQVRRLGLFRQVRATDELSDFPIPAGILI